MNDVNGIKVLVRNLHNLHDDKNNRDLIELYIARLKDAEINVLNKIKKDFEDDPTFNFTAAKIMTHDELFRGIEDLAEIYK